MSSPSSNTYDYDYDHGIDLFYTVLGPARCAASREDLAGWFYGHLPLDLADHGIVAVRDLVRQTLFVLEYAGRNCFAGGRAEWTAEDTVYRVSYNLDTDSYEILCFGMNQQQAHEGRYRGYGTLPKWIQERISVLSIMKTPPPIVDVPGVGRRMGEHLYWVYP